MGIGALPGVPESPPRVHQGSAGADLRQLLETSRFNNGRAVSFCLL